MSLFLGHVHFWLFDKIRWFEALEQEMIQYAKTQGLPGDDWATDLAAQFGAPVGNQALESVIDTGNIHGWLQDKIHRAEGRHAALVTRILGEGAQHVEGLKELFAKQGALAAGNNARPVNNPEELYAALNDFILEGMPCDRVNEVVVSENNRLQWVRTTCLHQQHWDGVQGDVRNFYDLRDAWVTAFVENLHPEFTFERLSEDTQAIARRVSS